MGDWLFAHDGQAHQVRQVLCERQSGTMIGIAHTRCPNPFWLSSNAYVLCARRTRSYGGDRSWKHVPPQHFAHARAIRKPMTPAERAVWSILRNNQIGVKFRRQHPIGPYIADFYSWAAGLVVEVDGDTHATPDAQDYDVARTRYLEALGLTEVRVANRDVLQNREAVADTIYRAAQAVRPSDDHYREWRRADSLRVGDTISCSVEVVAVSMASLDVAEVDESLFAVEIEGGRSFITAACIVSNP